MFTLYFNELNAPPFLKSYRPPWSDPIKVGPNYQSIQTTQFAWRVGHQPDNNHQRVDPFQIIRDLLHKD